MSKPGRRVLLTAAWALGLAGCSSSATQNSEEAPPRYTRHIAAAAQAQTKQTAPPGAAPATGSAQVTTVTDLPAARFEVPQVVLADALVSRRINTSLTQLLLTDFLEDSSSSPVPHSRAPRSSSPEHNTRLLTAAQAIERAAAEYEANGQVGVFGTSFEVLYNQHNALSLALTTEYSGAYPWSATRHATFDLRTGRRLALADLLADTLALRQRWHARINSRLAAYQKEIAQDYKNDVDSWATVRDYTGWSDTLRQVRPARRPALREFALTKRGLVLYTGFEFPHVALALAPPHGYLFAYTSLRPRLPSASLLPAKH
ncbi:MAG: hypothetical protein ACRYF0_02595 [Janthinobacterium lividum]